MDRLDSLLLAAPVGWLVLLIFVPGGDREFETAPDRRQLPLVFDAPKRGKPPKHWADLSVDDRVQAVQTMGMPKFRAQQLSRHYFEHLNNDPQEWTDLPGHCVTNWPNSCSRGCWIRFADSAPTRG